MMKSPSKLKRGYTKVKQKKKRRGAYFICETCGEEFYVMPSYIKWHEKNNTQIRFCSMKCYDKTGEKNPFFGKKHTTKSIEKMSNHSNRSKFGCGKENPNFIRFGEDFGFNGSHEKWWKRKLLNEIGKCEDCGYNIKEILELHHIDKNRSNNTRENLLLLCPNCHTIRHYKEKTGKYHFLKKCG